jgi:hypothetical protein
VFDQQQPHVLGQASVIGVSHCAQLLFKRFWDAYA